MNACGILLRSDAKDIEKYVEDKLFFISFLNNEQRDRILVHFMNQGTYLKEIREKYADAPEYIIRIADKAEWDHGKIVDFIIDSKEGVNMNYNVVSFYVSSIINKIIEEEREEPKTIKFQTIRERMDRLSGLV